MAIDQSEVTVATEETAIVDEAPDEVILDDPLSPEDRAARVALTAAELRQRALGNLLPIWTRERHRLAEANGDLEDAKGQVKSAKAALERQEASLEHVGGCRLDHCLRCEEIATNAPPKSAVDFDDDDEADAEPIADADRVAEQEAAEMEADDQVEAQRETAEVVG